MQPRKWSPLGIFTRPGSALADPGRAQSSVLFRSRRLDGRVDVRVERGLVQLEVERIEVEAVAVADLLERGEQLCFGLRSPEGDRERIGRLDRDLPVLLEACRRRDELPDDDVLLQPVQSIDLALDRASVSTFVVSWKDARRGRTRSRARPS
jgi:hypothetical protein